jgi:hypothetical protein
MEAFSGGSLHVTGLQLSGWVVAFRESFIGQA